LIDNKDLESIFTEPEMVAVPGEKPVTFKTCFSNARFTMAALSAALAFSTFSYLEPILAEELERNWALTKS
jgi:hypothetical protein